MAFEPITTQEQFDEAISRRLEQKEAKVRKEFEEKYADYDSLKSSVETLTSERDDYKAKFTEHESSIAELNSKVARYETDSVKTEMAMKHGLPYEMASRLKDGTKEEIEEDAQKMSKYIKASGNPAPSFIREPDSPEGREAAKKEHLKSMLRSMKGE